MASLNRRDFLLTGLVLSIDLPEAPALADESATPLPAALRDDPRLARPVTLRLKRKPLAEVLAEIGAQTRARLEASPEVADEPAILFVNARPARDVMAQLAALFRYSWRRRGAGSSARYLFYQDTAARQEEERLREEERQRLLETFRAQVERYRRLSQRPPEELLKEAQSLQGLVDAEREGMRRLPPAESMALQSTRGYREREADLRALRAMADPQQRALVGLVATLTRAQWDALLDHEPHVFSSLLEPGSLALPPALERALRAHAPAWDLPGERIPTGPQFDEPRRQYLERLREAWGRAEGFRITLETQLAQYIHPRSLNLLVKSGAVVPERPLETLRQRELRISTARLHLPDPPAPEVSPEEAAEDLLLSQRRRPKMEWKPEDTNDWWNRWLTEVLAGLAKSYSLNLVADGYRVSTMPPPRDRSREELSLYEALNHYVLPESRWLRDGAFVRARRWSWYGLRLTEVSDRAGTQWAEYLRARPSLTLDETAEWIHAFRDDQLEAGFGLVMEEEGIRLPEVMDPMVNSSETWPRRVVRAYAALPPAARERLKQGEPLAFADMPPAARDLLRRALREEMSQRPQGSDIPPTLAQLAEGSLRLDLLELRRAVTQNDYGFSVEFHITKTSGRALRGGQPLAEGEVLRRIGAGTRPPAEGQSLHAAQFRYRLPDGRGADFTCLLPWVQLLPRPSR